MMNDEKYYVIFYDNVQLIENDQNKYKIFYIISKAAIFERKIKMISNVCVSHNLKFLNNKKKNVAIFFSRKNIVTSIKKNSKRFFKKCRFDCF